MAPQILETLKNIFLVLEETRRLNENIEKLIARSVKLEDRVSQLEKLDAVRASEAKSLTANISVAANASMAVAVSKLESNFLERVLKLETAVSSSSNQKGQLAPPKAAKKRAVV